MGHLRLDLSCMERGRSVCTLPKTREPWVRRSYIVEFASGKPSMLPFSIPRRLFSSSGYPTSDPSSNHVFVRPTHHIGSPSKHTISDVDRGVVIPIDELAFRLVGGTAPLQASDLSFRIESPTPFHDCERFVVDYRRTKLLRETRVEPTRAFSEGTIRWHANLPLSTKSELC
eukprot:scaffold644_cov357-Pavlova_lutheri.AAC.34